MQVTASWSYDRDGIAGSTFPSLDKAIAAFLASANNLARLEPAEANRIRQASKYVLICAYREALALLRDGHGFVCDEDGLTLWVRPYP